MLDGATHTAHTGVRPHCDIRDISIGVRPHCDIRDISIGVRPHCAAAGLEDVVEADEVGLDVGVGVGDGVADAGLGGEVDDDVEVVVGEEFVDGGFVGDVATNEGPTVKHTGVRPRCDIRDISIGVRPHCDRNCCVIPIRCHSSSCPQCDIEVFEAGLF